jgi:hypothetical protein
MSWILIFAFVVIAVAVLVALKGKQGGSGTLNVPYQPAKALFSPAERSFLGVLDQAVGSEHRVFGKVRVADLATVKPGLSNAARQGALNRIAAKHVDFVVCRTSDLAVVCAVELNDTSHSSQRAKARDDLLLRICRVINLPLIQVPAKQAYSAQDLRTEFLTVVSRSFDIQAK